MGKADGFIAWFLSHKAALGAFLLSLATITGGTATIYKSDELVKAAAVMALAGGALSGGGLMKSDQFYRDRQEVLDTKVDRRAPAASIPQADLKKLEAKVEEKPKPEPPPYREVP